MASATALLAASSIASGVGGGISSIAAGQNQQANAEFQADLARRNARSAQGAAAAREGQSRRAARRPAGRTRAAIGAAGLARSGTPLDLLADQAAEQELDALTIRAQGASVAGGQRARAGLLSARGDQAARAGLVSGATQAAGGLLSAEGQLQSEGASLFPSFG